MKKNYRTAATVFAVVLMLVISGCSKTKQTAEDTSLTDVTTRGLFVLGLDDSFPPLGFRDENNDIVGYDIDLAKEVAVRLGVKFKAQPIEWDAKEQELNTGKIDCIWNGFTITPEREKELTFTSPYLDNDQVLVVRSAGGVKTLADMAGKVIGLQSGSSAQEAVDGNTGFKNSLKNIVMFKDNITALNDLEIGGVDGVVMDSVVAEYSIAMTKKPFSVLPESLSKEEYGVAFRKGDIRLRDKVQEILGEMQKDGTVTAVSRKWFGRDISVIGK
ncbi:MAG: amino acid ABC transporter substrate-binding protein [Treponema sp.]|jgi:polar amino acid transport system substrate-binding protein|nr:amino acid ABC transporter substrate-binding protein [Treponema sp.]